LESGNGPIIFTSSEDADRVLKNFKKIKIENYEVILRPFASYKDSFIAFIADINPKISEEQLQ
jgi:hypothetical protein